MELYGVGKMNVEECKGCLIGYDICLYLNIQQPERCMCRNCLVKVLCETQCPERRKAGFEIIKNIKKGTLKKIGTSVQYLFNS